MALVCCSLAGTLFCAGVVAATLGAGMEAGAGAVVGAGGCVSSSFIFCRKSSRALAMLCSDTGAGTATTGCGVGCTAGAGAGCATVGRGWAAGAGVVGCATGCAGRTTDGGVHCAGGTGRPPGCVCSSIILWRNASRALTVASESAGGAPGTGDTAGAGSVFTLGVATLGCGVTGGG